MVAHGYAHTRSRVVEHENGEEKPIPAEKIKVCGNSSESKNSSYNQKATRHPLHTIERNIFEHIIILRMNRKITNFFFTLQGWALTLIRKFFGLVIASII